MFMNAPFLNGTIILSVVVSGTLLLMPRLARMRTWRAMITPLASIIGSGFLVLGPILDASYGKYAPLVMGALCAMAYLFGWAIRFNIAMLGEMTEGRGRLIEGLELVASWALAFAYVISVTYYLNLFGAFGVDLTPVADPLHARILTSAVFLFVLGFGWVHGFRSLETMEYLSVTAKLAIIAGLVVGLGDYFAGKLAGAGLVFNAPERTGWQAVTLAFGLIVTVQGFETSRYLGGEYDSATRARSMRWAQWLSTAIYMVYIGLMSYVFSRGELKLSETAIVEMMGVVAPILPALLVGAALAAQFSAAVADTGGSGGLVAELTRGHVSERQGYAILTVLGLLLTWSADVFEIISYASRAFAAYYAIQAAIAALGAVRSPAHRHKAPAFAALALLGVVVVVFGEPVKA